MKKNTLAFFATLTLCATQSAYGALDECPIKDIGDRYLRGNTIYEYVREELEGRSNRWLITSSFRPATCYALTLSDAPLSALKEALGSCLDAQVIETYVTILCNSKGALSTEKELFLQEKARSIQAQNPQTKFLTDSKYYAFFTNWPRQWSDTEDLIKACEASLFGGSLSLPKTDPFTNELPKRCGHFDPIHFLERSCKRFPLALTHFEKKHTRLFAHAWLPALCIATTRVHLQNALAQALDPEKNLLKQLSEEALKICTEYDKAPKSCTAARRILRTFLADFSEDLTQEAWSTLEQTFENKVLNIKENSQLALVEDSIRHLNSCMKKKASDSKITTLANRLLEGPNDTGGVQKFVKKQLLKHQLMLSPKQIEELATTLTEARLLTQQAVFENILQEAHAHCLILLHRQEPLPEADVALLKSASENLCATPLIMDKQLDFMSNIWACFDSFKINTSEHEWSGAVRCLKKHPWVNQLCLHHPQKAEVLLAYRAGQYIFPPQEPFETKAEYCEKYVKRYCSRKEKVEL